MKICFDSTDEIFHIAEHLLQAYPADIVIELDGADQEREEEDKELPWDTEGNFYPEIHVQEAREPDYEQDCAYLAGELDAFFMVVRMGKLALSDVSKIMGRPVEDIRRLYRAWERIQTIKS